MFLPVKGCPCAEIESLSLAHTHAHTLAHVVLFSMSDELSGVLLGQLRDGVEKRDGVAFSLPHKGEVREGKKKKERDE